MTEQQKDMRSAGMNPIKGKDQKTADQSGLKNSESTAKKSSVEDDDKDGGCGTGVCS
jgi:hypothetical protein